MQQLFVQTAGEKCNALEGRTNLLLQGSGGELVLAQGIPPPFWCSRFAQNAISIFIV